MKCELCNQDVEDVRSGAVVPVTRNGVEMSVHVDINKNHSSVGLQACDDCFWRTVLDAEDMRHHGTIVVEI